MTMNLKRIQLVLNNADLVLEQGDTTSSRVKERHKQESDRIKERQAREIEARK